MRADPLVQAVLDRFPGAEIVAVRGVEGEAGDGGADEASPGNGIEDLENG